LAYYIWPPFAMYRAIALCNLHSFTVALPVRRARPALRRASVVRGGR